MLYPYQGQLDLAVERKGNEFHIRHGDLLDMLSLPPEGTRPEVVRRKLGEHPS